MSLATRYASRPVGSAKRTPVAETDRSLSSSGWAVDVSLTIAEMRSSGIILTLLVGPANQPAYNEDHR